MKSIYLGTKLQITFGIIDDDNDLIKSEVVNIDINKLTLDTLKQLYDKVHEIKQSLQEQLDNNNATS